MLPWALPLVFAGLIFRWFFEYQTGIVNDVLMRLGGEPLPWLSSPTLATIAVCVAIVWKSSSFMTLLLAGLQSIPRSLYEAAEVDGATTWQQFVEITLPMRARLKPCLQAPSREKHEARPQDRGLACGDHCRRQRFFPRRLDSADLAQDRDRADPQSHHVLISLMVPLFKVMRELGLLNTYLALILPYAVLSLPVCTLVLASFFQDIPPDLEAAAMVDGCSRVGALFHVVIPLSAPGVFTAAILAFVNAWDEFLLALTMMNRVSMRTLSVGITLYQGEFAFPWPLISAALFIAIVPICIIIAIFQERVVGGLTSGGVKG